MSIRCLLSFSALFHTMRGLEEWGEDTKSLARVITQNRNLLHCQTLSGNVQSYPFSTWLSGWVTASAARAESAAAVTLLCVEGITPSLVMTLCIWVSMLSSTCMSTKFFLIHGSTPSFPDISSAYPVASHLVQQKEREVSCMVNICSTS